jgi:hypothetical protein
MSLRSKSSPDFFDKTGSSGTSPETSDKRKQQQEKAS